MTKKKLYIDALPLAVERMSGVGHLTLEIVRALASNKDFSLTHEIRLILPLGKSRVVMGHGLPNLKIKVIPVPARLLALLNKFGLIPPLDLLLGKGTYLFPNYRNWPLAFSKSLTYVHDVSFELYPETVQTKNLAYLRSHIATWLRRSDRIITLTESAKSDIVEILAVDPKIVSVVMCGVDTTHFTRRGESAVRAVALKYNLPSKPYILYVGNLEPRKNLLRLLGAYSKLKRDTREQYPLVIVGAGGWLNDEVELKMDELGKKGLQIVRPKTFVSDEDLPAVYSGAALYVHPAIHEGFGIPPIEALACATPVAASDIPVLNEVLGSAVEKFDPYDETSIKKAIQDSLSGKHDQQEHSKAGIALAEHYSWATAARQLASVIEDVENE